MYSWFRRAGGCMSNCLDFLGTKLADYMRCRSNCCNNVNIYTPDKCNIGANKWIRAITPNCAILQSNSNEFYTPKN